MEEPPPSVATAATAASGQPTAQQLKTISGKRAAAAYINNDLANSAALAALAGQQPQPQHQQLLDEFLHLILNPEWRIDDSDNIEWCKFLIAGGRTPAEFAAIGE